MRALGEAATHLPWLSPCAGSLLALARSANGGVWEAVRHDPGAVLLVLRQVPAAAGPAAVSSQLRDPAILDGALRYLEQPPAGGQDPPAGFVDWGQAAVRPIYVASLTYARLAAFVAERTQCGDSEAAWVAGLLAPLGWLAVCAVDPAGAADCLRAGHAADQLSEVQRRRWGLDQAALARRLAVRWRLPAWLTACVGHLGLPVETARALGADPDLFRITQLAVGLGQRHGSCLGLLAERFPTEAAPALGLSAEAQRTLEREAAALVEQPLPAQVWNAPRDVPLLWDVLALAAENRRWQDAPLLTQLESDLDHLHRGLVQQRSTEAERLQSLKLTALAELAAGAGHEINNPLAVISGQAQYLLGHEAEPARQKALQTIVSQAQRIHDILTELMQFARPPRPQKQALDVPDLVREVAAALGDLAAQRRVRLVYPEAEPSVSLFADPRQMRTALTCLLRNAIEAAPVDGWATVRWQTPAPDRLELIVEDSGSGPPPQREHLFDPFYSNRQAGRSRGLGLSTAWRLAREHGGEVYLDDFPGAPTRFVLSLPRVPTSNGTHSNGQGPAGKEAPVPAQEHR
jgi:signal transduction histidine kinase